MSKRKFFFGVLLPMLICCNLSFSQKDDKFYKSYTGHLYDFESLSFKEEFKGADIYKLSDKDKYYQVRFLDGKTDWVGVFNVDTFLLEEYLPGGEFTKHSGNKWRTKEGILSQNFQYSTVNGEIKKGKSYLTKFDDNHNESEVVLYDINGDISNIIEKKYDENNQLVQEIYLDKNRLIDTSDSCLCAIKNIEYKDYLKSNEFCYTFEKKLKHKKHFLYDSLGYEIESKETDEVDRILKKTISTYKTVENISDYQTYNTKFLNYREHYFFDNKGNVVEYQRTNSIDKLSEKKFYLYDLNGKEIETQLFDSYFNYVIEETKKEYNNKNQLVKIISFDWVDRTKTVTSIIDSNIQKKKYYTFIGIPFLDKNTKMINCDLCKSNNKKVVEYSDSLNSILANIKSDLELERNLLKVEIIEKEITNYKSLDSIYKAGQSTDKEILALLLVLKVDLLVNEIVEENGNLYNLSRSLDYDRYPNFIGVTKINDLIEEIIALNINEKTNTFFRELRMKYMIESSAFDENNVRNTYNNYKTEPNLKIVLKYELLMNKEDTTFSMNKIFDPYKSYIKPPTNSMLQSNATKQFFLDEKLTGYVPFNSFSGVGIGGIGSIGKDFWSGFEISLEYVDYTNPFSYSNPISDSPHFRFSLFGISYLYNTTVREKRDFSFNFFNFRHPYVNLNLLQFGLHKGVLDDSKWYYRPEIGFSYGIFKASYSYNFTFNKIARSLTEKSLFTFGISYPLIRIGKYY
jgi:hypothetical protein